MKHAARVASAVLILLLGVRAASAMTSLRGGTGVINTPNTMVGSSTTLYMLHGDLHTLGQWSAGGFAEAGVLREEDDTLYNLKLRFFPELGPGLIGIPSAAVGIRGMAKENDKREFYLALTKTLDWPLTMIVTFGLSRLVSVKADQEPFVGLQVPLFGRVMLQGEYEGRTGQYNGGIGVLVTDSVYLYSHWLDYSGDGPDADTKVYGISYGRNF